MTMKLRKKNVRKVEKREYTHRKVPGIKKKKSLFHVIRSRVEMARMDGSEWRILFSSVCQVFSS